eukprot:scaffold14843_cov70-Phaeocystis_antarctica.AAC.3
MAVCTAASVRCAADVAADAAGFDAVSGGEAAEAGATAGCASLGSSPAAAVQPAFFFLDFFERACPSACSAASSSGSSIAPSTQACAACSARNVCGATGAAGCSGAACCRTGSSVVVRPWALACRAVRCGRRCRAARCWPARAVRVRRMASVAIAPSTTDITTEGQKNGTIAHTARPKPSDRHDACCRRSSAMTV